MRFLAGFFLCTAGLWSQPADLIIRNAHIITLDSPARARAVASRGERILAVGTDAEIGKLAGPNTRVIDAGGALVIPGFIESHGHFMGLGQFQRSLNLREVKSWHEIVRMVAGAAKEARPGQWILGRGFHQSKWSAPPEPSVQGFPVHHELSRVSPANPVLLTHASGHAAMVNAAAMALAGINRATTNPEGGEILRDQAGEPTGLLNERAQTLVYEAYSKYLASRNTDDREQDARRDAAMAAAECLRNGITSFQDAGSSFETVDFFRRLRAENQLPVRLYVMLRGSASELLARAGQYRSVDVEKHRLTVRAIKRSIDGALGSRGAWLLKPYADLPSSSGLNTDNPDDVRRVAGFAAENGYQLCVHAIGDRANREVLDIFEQTFKDHPSRRDPRWRIEHAQHLSASDIPRFGKLRVIAAMQGIHCTSDAPYVLERLGKERAAEGAYVWRKLLDSGARIANGTDAPVEDVSPLASFYASVSRKLKDGSRFFPAQRMTRMEALRSYTIDAAYAAFEEDVKGSIKPGKLADFTVLSRDILTVPEDEIPQTEVLYTIVGGKVLYQRGSR